MTLANFGAGVDNPAGATPDTDADAATDYHSRPPIEHPMCCIGGCDTEVVGLFDGWDAHDRDGVACSACWDYHDRHTHWPDEEPEFCAECRIDAGAVAHDCPESPVDRVIVDAGDECPNCDQIQHREGGHAA